MGSCPSFDGSESVLLAVGIIGATVMPHVIYLHSALTQDRIVADSPETERLLMRYTRIDVIGAMTIAGLINVAMLVMAAATFYKGGAGEVASIVTAHKTLEPILGATASAVFAIALLGSGLSSLGGRDARRAGRDAGLHQAQRPVWVRRLVTMIPAFVVVALGLNPSRTLVLSQVVLSFGIPFALVPLVWFTSRRDLMGTLVNGRATTGVATAIACLIIGLNVFLIAQLF